MRNWFARYLFFVRQLRIDLEVADGWLKAGQHCSLMAEVRKNDNPELKRRQPAAAPREGVLRDVG